MNETPIIKCPVCGAEYHPAEIYYPDSFFGHPTEVVKTEADKIDFIMGPDMDLNESFICENCNSRFKVHANVSFDVETDEAHDFSKDYSTEFKKPKKIVLAELND